TAIVFAVTVTLVVAVVLPSFVEAVITVLPAFNAFTSPLESTNAIVAALLFHSKVLSVAFAGRTVAVMVLEDPTVRESSVGFKVIDLTSTVLAVTVTFALADNLPSFVETVISVSPGPTASTSPVAETLATFVSPLFQVTSFSLASSGVVVATKVSLSPTSKSISDLSSFNSAASIGVTSTSIFAETETDLLVIVIVAFPILIAVSSFPLTEMISAFDDIISTSLS